MATFTQTVNPTAFGFFDSDLDFQIEADNMVTFVLRRLGDDILSVELTQQQIWLCFEEAFLEYGAIINTHQARNQMQSFLGQATGSLSGSEQLYLRETLNFLERQAEPYAFLAGSGGPYNHVLGKIDLVSNQQDYNLVTDLTDENDTPLYDLQPTGSRSKLRVMEVFHFSPGAAYRFFDSTSAINFLNNEFSFESFTPETIFYILPVFEDILRAGQMDVSQRVRRSNFSYEIIGTKLRIFPMPTTTDPRNLYVKVTFPPDPTGRITTVVSGADGVTTVGLGFPDDSVFGVSNISNIPFGNLEYARINSVGRQWVRQYTLALSREVLGIVRSKFSTVPIPNSDLTLDGATLVTQGREDKERLLTTLREMLESLTYDQLITREADKSEAIIRQLKGVPMPIGKAIFMG